MLTQPSCSHWPARCPWVLTSAVGPLLTTRDLVRDGRHRGAAAKPTSQQGSQLCSHPANPWPPATQLRLHPCPAPRPAARPGPGSEPLLCNFLLLKG